ncbi:efflux RND transporter periplasmic adaptor subunit [Glaciecola siphonariae]|uniref:Efflux RND transporter periplasmic adaptor subunit n=1 Tax=Glaciecola siphonariae TaxID=521012 RepID=A0ABV9LXG1_9ALTE
MNNFKHLFFTFLALSALAACGTDNQTDTSNYAPQVDVANVAVASIANWHEFTGTMQAPETIALRPRVSGYIDRVHFEEGSFVAQGELLFSIDSAPFTAEVNRLKADLSIATSQQNLAKKEFERANSLIKKNAISRELLDTRSAAVAQTKARADAVSAALEAAQLQLSYTQITAPISGRVSNAYITQGNFVNAGESVLTSLVSSSQLHTYFNANQSTYLAFKEAQTSAKAMPVLMSVDGGQAYTIGGVIDFVDNRIDPQTGTIRARAVFDNQDSQFVPGLFTRLRVYGSASEDVVLIQDRAVGTDLNNKYVLVLNSQNQVEYRAVTLGEKVSSLRIVTSGLAPNDKIVVNGLQRVRPGAEVSPQMVSIASEQTLSQINQRQSQIAAMQANINNSVIASVN